MIKDAYRQFHRAHDALIQKLGGTDAVLELIQIDHSHFSVMKQAWRDHYGVVVSGPPSRWDYLEFRNENAYLLWMMKWS